MSVLLSLAGQIEDLEFKLTGTGWDSILETEFKLKLVREDLNELSTKKKCEEYYQKYVSKKHFDHKILLSNLNEFYVIREQLRQQIQLFSSQIPPGILSFIENQNEEHINWYHERIANSENELKNISSYDKIINDRYGELMTKQLHLTHKHAELLELLEETKSEQFQKLKKLLNIDD